jgi:lipoyl synthase
MDDTLRLSVPTLTRTISVTGKECAKDCAHCGKRYIAHMETPQEVRQRGPRHYRSALMSGGMNEKGWVPHEGQQEFIDTLLGWKWRLNFHVGLMPPHAALALRGKASIISFDFLVHDETIKDVYGLEARGRDYCAAYEMLADSFPVVPHITLGLRAGEMGGEREALKALKAYHPDKIVFLIFVPTRGTRFGICSPPALEEVESFFSFSRELFPGASLSLGCMRPRGVYGEKVEEIALASNFSTLVMPSRRLKEHVRDHQIPFETIEECCAL